jgi:hypothetical protein
LEDTAVEPIALRQPFLLWELVGLHLRRGIFSDVGTKPGFKSCEPILLNAPIFKDSPGSTVANLNQQVIVKVQFEDG